MDMNEKINKVLDRIRPYLLNDGGDVQFVKYENGVVYVKLLGSCGACPIADSTIEDTIEAALMNEVPEVVKVVNQL